MNTSLDDSALGFGQSPPSYYASHPAEAKRDANDLIHTYLDQSLTVVRRGKIAQPVGLPQMARGFDMPFTRAYAHDLAELGISQEVFLKFIDGLNAAMIASPPLQVVGLVGLIIGFVYVCIRQPSRIHSNSKSRPHEICGLISAGIQVGAQIGIRVLSKTLTDRYLRDANARIFAPAGLRVRICKTPAMRALVKVPWIVPPSRPSCIKRLTRRIKRSSSAPAEDRVRPVIINSPLIDPSISNPLTRRIKPYEKHFLPITFDVPPPIAPSGVVNKLSDYAVNLRRTNLTKRAESVAARRQLLAGVPVTRELTWRDRKVIKKLAKGKEDEIRRDVVKGDEKELRSNEKILWLVIVNEDEGAA